MLFGVFNPEVDVTEFTGVVQTIDLAKEASICANLRRIGISTVLALTAMGINSQPAGAQTPQDILETILQKPKPPHSPPEITPEQTKPTVEAAAPQPLSTLLARPPRNSNTSKPRTDCTWITDKPSGHYMGTVCNEGNNRVEVQHTSWSGQYIYGRIIVNGVKKCGTVRSGIVKTVKPKHPSKACEYYYEKLKTNRYIIGEDFNCGQSKKTRQRNFKENKSRQLRRSNSPQKDHLNVQRPIYLP